MRTRVGLNVVVAWSLLLAPAVSVAANPAPNLDARLVEAAAQSDT